MTVPSLVFSEGMYVAGCLLAVMAAASAVVFFARFFELRRMRVDPEDFVAGVANVLAKGGADEALSVCEETPGPVSGVVAAAIRSRDAPPEDLRAISSAAAEAAADRLDRRAAPLAAIAQTAPLCGLAGTVMAMVKLVAEAGAGEVVARAALLDGLVSTFCLAGFGIAVAAGAHVMFAVPDSSAGRLCGDVKIAAAGIAAAVAAARAARGGKTEAAK